MSGTGSANNQNRPGARSRRRQLRTGLAGGTLLSLGWIITAPGLGLGQAARAATSPPGPTCSSAQLAATANASGHDIAGYTLGGSAAGYRYELDSPGLLPVGDPQQGNITELDVPYARENVSSGPLVASLGSAAYPGDTAAGVGSALGEFGFKGVPNDPVLASAAYPPSPSSPASSSYPTSSEPSTVNAGAARAAADQNGGTSEASVSSYSLASGATQEAGGGPAQSDAAVHLGAACVDSVSDAVASGIVVAGIIHIASVSGSAQAMSDGIKAVPAAALHVGNVTVAGLAAYIDQNGVHLAGQQPVGYGVVAGVQAALDAALKNDGITIKVLNPQTLVTGADATVTSGGLDIVVQRTLPAIGVPGVPAITVPGQAPIPLGTPGAPVRYQVTLGEAQASVFATTAPAPGSLASASPTGSTGGPSSSSAASASSSSPGAPIGSTSGGTTLSASPSPGSPSGVSGPGSGLASDSGSPGSSPVPAGWVIIGVLVAIMAAAPLLGYARWQLLEGRI
ncbi:MAG TPA: hypothetical protein VNF50_00230 [Acidimicrobiales bacterium]|nr:hypothetical protein [Acidimicrobiales bacterium]